MQPVEQEGEQLMCREVQAGLPGLDQGVELLGQKPETMGSFQSTTFRGVGDAVEVSRGRCVRQLDQRVEGQKLVEQEVEQEFACAVGEGSDPFPGGGAGRAQAGQLIHQAVPPLTYDEIEGDGILQQADHVAPVGVQEVRQQAMRATTDLASNPLNSDEEIDVPCEGMPLVGTPADQTIGGLTLGVGTTLGDGKAMTRKGDCFGGVLDGIGEVLYNDHVVGTPPRVVKLGSLEPLREVSSFLAQLLAIIPPFRLFRQAWQLSWPSWYSFLADQSAWPFALCLPSPLEAQLFYLAKVGPVSVRESGP